MSTLDKIFNGIVLTVFSVGLSWCLNEVTGDQRLITIFIFIAIIALFCLTHLKVYKYLPLPLLLIVFLGALLFYEDYKFVNRCDLLVLGIKGDTDNALQTHILNTIKEEIKNIGIIAKKGSLIIDDIEDNPFFTAQNLGRKNHSSIVLWGNIYGNNLNLAMKIINPNKYISEEEINAKLRDVNISDMNNIISAELIPLFYIVIAKTRHQERRYSEAIKYYELCSENNKKSEMKLFDPRGLLQLKGDCLSDSAQVTGEIDVYNEAIKYYSMIINENKDMESIYEKNALYNRGLCYLKCGNYNNALADYNDLINIDEQADAYTNRGIVYYRLKQYRNAFNDYYHAIDINPEYARVWYNYAIYYIRSGSYKEALICINNAIGINSKDYTYLTKRADIYFYLEDYDRALEDYTKAIKINHNDASLFVSRGCTFLNNGQYKEAINNCNFAISIQNDNSLAYLNRGVAYYRLDNFTKALENINEAIRLGNTRDKGVAFRELANIYYKEGHYQAAIDYVNYSIILSPDDYKSYNLKGIIFHELTRYLLAIEEYLEAIELNPQYDVSYYNAGLAYRKLGNYYQALECFKKAIEINPQKNEEERVFLKGLAYYFLGEYENALTDFTRVLELNSKSGICYYFRSFCYKRIGENIKSESDMKKANKLGYDESYYW